MVAEHFRGELKDVTRYALTPQLMAVEPADFLRAAELFPDGTAFIELNAGCPSPTCVGKGAGSSMLRVADEFHETVATLAPTDSRSSYGASGSSADGSARLVPSTSRMAWPY